MKRPVAQDASNPVCEGSGIAPLIEVGFCVVTDDWRGRFPCPVCGAPVTTNRLTDRIRKHRRLPDAPINPHGFFVYILWGMGRKAVYVGQSTNVLGRLGYHMSKDKTKLTATQCVELIRCTDRDDMNATEIKLIRTLKPLLNTIHHPDADRECYRRSSEAAT